MLRLKVVSSHGMKSVLLIEEGDLESTLNPHTHNEEINDPDVTGNISGYIDILLHPAYQVPCPYLRLWNRSGSYLTIEQAQPFLDKHSCCYQGDDIKLSNSSSLVSHAVFPFGRLIQDLHPYDGYACYTIHVCEISNYIDMCLQSKGISTIPKENAYMLVWLSIVGPHIGLPIAPSEYRAGIDLLVHSIDYREIQEHMEQKLDQP